MKKKRPHDVRVTVDAVTWATSAEDAIRLTEQELREGGFMPAPGSTASEAQV